jgi:hypothetical protein
MLSVKRILGLAWVFLEVLPPLSCVNDEHQTIMNFIAWHVNSRAVERLGLQVTEASRY